MLGAGVILIDGLNAELAVERGELFECRANRLQLLHHGLLEIVLVKPHAIHRDAKLRGRAQNRLGVRLVGAEHVGSDHRDFQVPLGQRVDELRQFVDGFSRFDFAAAADRGFDAVEANVRDRVWRARRSSATERI